MRIVATKIKSKKSILDPAKFKAAANKALDKVARDVQEDYKSTWRTFTRVKPTADITTPGEGQRTISVSNKIYGYLDFGTRPHMIRARRAKFLFFAGSGFRAKTTPGVIGSSAGSRGIRNRFAKAVRHPGIKPRLFTKAIYEKRKNDLQKELDKAIREIS